jgi:hypothetical protein
MITWEEIRDIIEEEVYIGSGAVLGVNDAAKAIVARIEAAQQSGASDGLHSCLCGDRIPLDEYCCSNCRAWETTRA